MYYVYADGELIYQPGSEQRTLSRLSLELELGKAGTLSFDMPPTNPAAERLRQLRTQITVEEDGETLFRGRVLSISRDFQNNRSVSCEGELAYLVDSVQKSAAFAGTNHELFRSLLKQHNARVEKEKQFLPGTVTVARQELVISGQSDGEAPAKGSQIVLDATPGEWQTTYDRIQSCLIDTCGGYLTVRWEGGQRYLDWLEQPGRKASQPIAFGVNMLDLTQEATPEELFTVLIPLGEENLTVEKVNGGSDELADAQGVAAYGRILRSHVFDGVTKPETLLQNGKKFLAEHANIPLTVTVNAIDLHLLDAAQRRIDLGDNAEIQAAPQGIGGWLVCTRIERDLVNTANTQYTFGTARQTLTERYQKDAREKERDRRRGGGGAAKAVEEESENFFREWINIDPANPDGKITLGTAYEYLQNIANTTGLDMTVTDHSSRVDLKAMRHELDETTKETTDNAAQLNLLADEQKSFAELTASWQQKTDSSISAWGAGLTLEANERKEAVAKLDAKYDARVAALELTANDLKTQAVLRTEYEEGQTSILNLMSKTDKSLATLQTSHQTLLDRTATLELNSNKWSSTAQIVTRMEGQIAGILVRTDTLSSEIVLKADQVTIDGKLNLINQSLGELRTDIINTKSMITEEIDAKIADIKWLEAKVITVAGMTIQGQLNAKRIVVPEGGFFYFHGERVATTGDIDRIVDGKGFLKSIPSTLRPAAVYARQEMRIKDQLVATQAWVQSYVRAQLLAHGIR